MTVKKSRVFAAYFFCVFGVIVVSLEKYMSGETINQSFIVGQVAGLIVGILTISTVVYFLNKNGSFLHYKMKAGKPK